MTTTTETRITKAEAIEMLEIQPVFARLNDGSEVRVGAIAWTTWIDLSEIQCTQYQVDDARYFFTKN
jgi:hypothetical protein